MTITPPEGSGISVLTTDVGAPTIIIPAVDNEVSGFQGAFLVIWLVGWFVGLIITVPTFLPRIWNMSEGLESTLFNVVWLVGWTAGGLFLIRLMIQSLRPPVPASLRLAQEGIDFDSGFQPPPLTGRFYWRDWSLYFPKRIRRRIGLGELKTLHRREFETGSRLTVDIGNARIEIARGATDAEREWLFRLLVDRYKLKTEE